MSDHPITYHFRVDGAPVSTNRLHRIGGGHAYLSPAAKAWKLSVETAAMLAGCLEILPEGDLSISVTYYHPHLKRRLDLDNIIKGILDGLGAYFNDKRIVSISASRIHSPNDPHVKVKLHVL